jgi:hypothetical protein
LTWTATQGGKTGWPPAPGLFLQSGKAFLKETLPPFADNLAGQIQASRDAVIGQAFGRQKNNLGPNDVSIR